MIDIIVVGYPKSGNTWVTRLVAELVGCPVVGFLDDANNPEIAREGFNRKSNYQCFKSHHQLHELRGIETNDKKIIYVIRDPRDICISGSYYFHYERWSFLGKVIRRVLMNRKAHNKIYSNFLNQIITTRDYRIKLMAQAVLYGSKEVHDWVRIPWVTHYKPYIDNQHFFIKYEDLLCNPERECKQIVRFLGLDRNESLIKKAIEKQSFKNKKEEFIKNEMLHKAAHMRTGKKEQWKQELSEKVQKEFRTILTDELNQFQYPTNNGTK